jgi:hypothetical protein
MTVSDLLDPSFSHWFRIICNRADSFFLPRFSTALYSYIYEGVKDSLLLFYQYSLFLTF